MEAQTAAVAHGVLRSLDHITNRAIGQAVELDEALDEDELLEAALCV